MKKIFIIVSIIVGVLQAHEWFIGHEAGVIFFIVFVLGMIYFKDDMKGQHDNKE